MAPGSEQLIVWGLLSPPPPCGLPRMLKEVTEGPWVGRAG